MNLKHLGISAIALGLLVGGGAAYSTFASANNEVNTNKANTVYESKVNFTGAGSYSFNGTDELPEGVIYKDEIKGETNSGAGSYSFNGIEELPEGAIYKDEIKGETNSGTEYYSFDGTDELPEGVIWTDAIQNGEIKN